MTDNGSVFICWHPEKPFPYECSKPLPEVVTTSNTVLKIENKADIYSVFKKKSPEMTRAELAKITHTCVHRWFPKARTKKVRHITMDRPYL